MIYVMMIALNEQKFIKSSIRSVAKRKEVGGVTIVEGADIKYPKDKLTAMGLSIDNTFKEAIASDYLINYAPYGFAEYGKTELRQTCIDLVYKEHNPTPRDWGLFVDADELWSDLNWEKLMKAIKQVEHVGSIYFHHLHFWKNLHTLAVGGQWDMQLFRLFRFAEKGMELRSHAGEPVCSDGTAVGQKYGSVRTDGIYVHHYGGMKDESDILDKLEYYKERDKHLNVVNTWSEWEEGKPTQWTHEKGGRGGTERFWGVHPVELINVYPEARIEIYE